MKYSININFPLSAGSKYVSDPLALSVIEGDDWKVCCMALM